MSTFSQTTPGVLRSAPPPTKKPVATAVSPIWPQRATLTPPEYVVSPGTYDQKHIDRIGRLKSCIAYGPGILDLTHQPDEWVGIDDMVNAGQVMALALDNLLHGAGPGA